MTEIPDDLREEKNCCICGSARKAVVYQWPAHFYDREVYETCSWDGRSDIELSICRCTDCGHLYSSPAFRPKYLDFVYPADIIPDTDERIISEINSPKHQGMVDLVLEFFGTDVTAVDIGTRYGGLPVQLHNAGVDVSGLEYNSAAVRRGAAHGAPIVHGTVEDLWPVDVVTMDDVSEHLAYPDLDFRRIFDVLRPGGGLITRQMNARSVGHIAYRQDWYYLQPAAHMNYFSPRSLGRLLQSIGFDVVAIRVPSPVRVSYDTFIAPRLRRMNPFRYRQRDQKSVTTSRKTAQRPLYLTRRKRSTNDMFAVVAVKPRTG